VLADYDADVLAAPRRYSTERSLRATCSRDHPTLTLHDLNACRKRLRQLSRGAIGVTVVVENSPVWARSARPPVMNDASRPASFGVRCDVATQASPRHKLITTYPASLCHVARSSDRSPLVMNSRR
jgi:hypothetical protein